MAPRACRDIYTGPNALPISDIYRRFGDRDKGMMFVSPEPKHRQKRAKIVHVFSKPSIANLEPVLHQYSTKLLARIEENKGKPFNLLFWDRMLNMDVAGK
jgi:cytochrome P450